jgi:hypothetical protein
MIGAMQSKSAKISVIDIPSSVEAFVDYNITWKALFCLPILGECIAALHNFL